MLCCSLVLKRPVQEAGTRPDWTFDQPHPQERMAEAENKKTSLSLNAEEVLARAKEVREHKCLTEFDPAVVEENLASIRQTLEAIDDLNDRWKVSTRIL